jgi:hypothetical protein
MQDLKLKDIADESNEILAKFLSATALCDLFGTERETDNINPKITSTKQALRSFDCKDATWASIN